MAGSSLYTALPTRKSIRLLQILPADDGERLSCTLKVFENYEAAPRYQCLSYCWGDATDVADITCNGNPKLITKNLHAGLLQLRHHGEKRYLWADAICIDQDNVSERNQQVSIMDRIFGRSTRVLIWLGPEDDNTAVAMAMMEAMVSRFHQSFYSDQVYESWLRTAVSCQDIGVSLCSGDPAQDTNYTLEEWSSFWQFFDAQWFRRVWVIREVHRQNNAVVLCGGFSIPWTIVGLAASWSAHTGSRTIWDVVRNHASHTKSVGLHNADIMWRIKSDRRYHVPFLSLLDDTRGFCSSDPRDKIFALLRMESSYDREEQENDCLGSFSPNPNYGFPLPVNYNQSVIEVYRGVAVMCLQHFSDAGILSSSWRSAHIDESWPSWVPRWDVECGHIPWGVAPAEHNAAKGTSFKYQLDTSLTSIVLNGVVCGTVSSISSFVTASSLENSTSVRSKSSHWQRLTQEILELRHLVSRYRGSISIESWVSYVLYRLEEHKRDIFIQLGAMICDSCSASIGQQHGADLTQTVLYHCWSCSNGDFDLCRTCYEGKTCRCRMHAHTMEKIPMKSLWIPYHTSLVNALASLKVDGTENFSESVPSFGALSHFIHTSLGARGSTSVYAKPGDIIVVFFGARVPFLLREINGAYRLISDCYIESLMDGEAIEMWERGMLQEEEFEIS